MYIFVFLKKRRKCPCPAPLLFLYIEVNLLCVLICGVILIRCLRSIDKRRKARYFCSMIICFEINFLCDLVWRIIDNHHASTPISLNYLINCLYFSAGTLGCYFWFMYAEISQGRMGQPPAAQCLACPAARAGAHRHYHRLLPHWLGIQH